MPETSLFAMSREKSTKTGSIGMTSDSCTSLRKALCLSRFVSIAVIAGAFILSMFLSTPFRL